MSDWMFDDGSATSLLSQDYGTSALPPVWDEPPPQGAPSEDPLFAKETELPPITVYPGQRPDTPPDGAGWGGTDTTQLDPDMPMEPPSCTPPPDGPTPAGVDIDELRRKARDLANGAADNDDSVEWGGLIWADANGDLHITELATDNRSDRAAFDLSDIPPGGRIVGTYHSHPHLRGENVNQGLLNSEDRLIVDALRAYIAENDLGIIIDPNAMMYVTDNEHGVTKEFDVSDPRNAYGTVLGPCGSR